MFPIEGMKQEPYGLPLLAGAWLSLFEFCAKSDEYKAAFKADTGHDLDSVLLARGIEKVIDKACGRDRRVLAAFGDWMTLNVWGDGSDPGVVRDD